MSNAVTRSTIRDTVRQRLDMVGSTLIADATFNQWIDDSTRELYDLLVESRGEDYYTAYQSFYVGTVANTADYALNTICGSNNFYKLRGLYLCSGTKRYSMRKVGLDEILRREAQGLPTNAWVTNQDPTDIVYCIFGNTVRFSPAPPAEYLCEAWYIPPFGGYANDSATFDAVNGWHEYIVADVCIKGAVVDEADPSVFIQQKQAQAERIGKLRANRDQYRVLQVRDTASLRRRRYPY